MMRYALTLALSFSLAACDLEGTPRDAGSSDASRTRIAFTLPDPSLEFARGTVRLQLVTTGSDPDRVELWKDGSLLVVLALPYTYEWLSDDDAEGEHVFEARALNDGAVVATAERRFTIDRSGPTLVDARPSAGSSARLADGIEIELSEALDPASITPESVTLQVDGASVPAARTLSSDGATIRVIPSEVILPASLTVTVTTVVTDRAGNAVAEPITHEVEYSAWTTLLPDGAIADGRAITHIAVSGSNTYVLHTDGSYRDPLIDVWDGTLLTALPPLPSAPAERWDSTELVVASTGALVAAWALDTAEIHVADYADGEWVERPVLPAAAATSFHFAFALGPRDEPHAARTVGDSRIQVMRLSGGTWAPLGPDIALAITSPSLSHFVFAMDEADPAFAIEDGARCLVYAAGGTYPAVNSRDSICQGVHIADVPGPGVDALLRVWRETATGDFVTETRHWTGPPWSRLATLSDAFFLAVTETTDGWIGAQPSRVVSSSGETWPLDTPQPSDVDLLLGAPIIAAGTQLYVPNGPPIAP